MENNYYILITRTEHFIYKVNNMLKLLSDQIENYSTPNKERKSTRILVCSDDIDVHMVRVTNYIFASLEIHCFLI